MVRFSQISFAKQNRVQPVKPKPKVPRYVLELDGVDDKVTVGITGFDSLPRMDSTISFWMYANHQNQVGYNEGALFGNSGYTVQASLKESGVLNVYRWNGATNVDVNIADFLQKWKKIDIVYTISDYRTIICIDGIAVSNTTGSLPAFSTISNFFLGDMHDGTNRFFNGLLYDFRIYNRALSADEVTQLYQGINIRNGLVLHHNYRLGHARDLSGNGNDGILNNGAKFNIVNYEEV